MKNPGVKRTFRDKAFPALLRSLGFLLTGRLRFRHDHIGEIIKKDRQKYTIFRQAVVSRKATGKTNPGAILTITFSFAHGSPKTNKRLSLIPIPFITGMPGFRSKTWAIRTDNGDFMGVYEWDSTQDIEKYKNSLAVKLMTKRAVPGSVRFRINKR